MTGAVFLRAGTALALVTMVMACEEFQETPRPDATADAAVTVSPTPETVTREVERPDIFFAAEEGLWDGRPSLGGIWVAHPDVSDPERVQITVPETGRTITGALFRRERDNPGPRIQVSSEAASALGLLGGAPTILEVVVLRTESVSVPPAPTPEPLPEEEVIADETIDALEVDETAPLSQDAAVDDATEVIAPVVAATAAAGAVAPKPRATFWDRLTGRNRTADAGAADPALGESTVSENLAATEGNAASIDEVAAEVAPVVETTTLDTLAAAALAIERAEADSTTTDIDTTETPAAPVDPDRLSTPFIEVGAFENESNADAAATALRQAGIPPLIRPVSDAGGTVWRVLAGPLASQAEVETLLSEVQALGYPSAAPAAN